MSDRKQHRSASDDANAFSYRERTQPSSTLCGQEPRDKLFSGVEGGAKPRRRARHLPMVLALKPYGEKIRRSKPCDIRRSKPCDFRRSKLCDAELVHAFVCSSTASKALSHCAFFFSSQGGLPTVPHCLYAIQTWQYVSLTMSMYDCACIYTYKIGGDHSFGRAKPCKGEAFCERGRSRWWHWQGEALHGWRAEPGIRNLHHAPPGTELIYLIAAWAVRQDPRIRVIL